MIAILLFNNGTQEILVTDDHGCEAIDNGQTILLRRREIGFAEDSLVTIYVESASVTDARVEDATKGAIAVVSLQGLVRCRSH